VTTGELLDAGLSYYLNQGSSVVVQDRPQRQKAHFWLTKAATRLWNSAPYWFRKGDGTVQLTAGVGTMPVDFSRIGTQGQIYISGQRYRTLKYRPPDWIKFQIQNNVQQGEPWAYTLYGQSSLGVPMILCWPQDGSLLEVLAYDKKQQELVDKPLALNATVSAAVGVLTGAYSYVVTFVTALGETEGGYASQTVNPAAKQVSLTDIPVWWGNTVTSRKVYRTAAGGLQYKLLTTIANNLATTFTDNVADVALGADVPLPPAAVTGLQQFPSDFHDSALYDGLQFLLARGQGDNRDTRFFAEWDRQVQRMWEEIQQGQNEVGAFPAFPGGSGGHGVWDRFTPPT